MCVSYHYRCLKTITAIFTCQKTMCSSIVIGAAYMIASLGPRAANMSRLAALAAFTSQLTVPWCFFGDWNMEPAELVHSGAVDNMEAMVWVPSGVTYTCTLPPFRMLVYGVMSYSFQPFAKNFRAIQYNLWLTHFVLEAEIDATVSRLRCWRLVLLMPFPQPPARKKAPNPHSKTKRKKAAEAAKRVAAGVAGRQSPPEFAPEAASPERTARAGSPEHAEAHGAAALEQIASEARNEVEQGSLRFLDADVQDETWTGFYGAAAEEDAPAAQGGAACSFIRNWLGDRAAHLGCKFARWANAIERFICMDLNTAPGRWCRYQGRGRVPRMELQAWGIRKPSIQCKATQAAHWWQAVAKYTMLYATCRAREHGERQQQVAKDEL